MYKINMPFFFSINLKICLHSTLLWEITNTAYKTANPIAFEIFMNWMLILNIIMQATKFASRNISLHWSPVSWFFNLLNYIIIFTVFDFEQKYEFSSRYIDTLFHASFSQNLICSNNRIQLFSTCNKSSNLLVYVSNQ